MSSAGRVPLALALIGLAAVAHAEPVDVAVTDLALHREGERLYVHVQLSERSWKFLQDNQVAAKLEVAVAEPRGKSRRVEAALVQSDDWLSFPVSGKAGAIAATVAVKGAGPNHEIEWMTLHGLQLYGLTVRVEPAGAAPSSMPRPGNWHRQPAVMRACAEAFSGAADESACLEVVRHFGYEPTQTIGACAAAMDGGASELDCLRAAADGHGDGTALLAACERSFRDDVEQLSCFRHALRARYAAATAIGACRETFADEGHALGCIELIATARFDPTPALRSCDGSAGADSVLACVRRAIAAELPRGR